MIQSPRWGAVPRIPGGNQMNLPKIDLSSLPDLDTLTGLFGSLLHTSRIIESDDSIVTLMAFVYETTTR